jgi:hypothetical protein
VVVPQYKTENVKLNNIIYARQETIGYTIETRSLYDHVMSSADRVFTPHGIIPDLFVKENPDGTAAIWRWGRSIQPYFTSVHENLAQAEQVLFETIYHNDYLSNEEISSNWFETEEEAILYRNIYYADLWKISTVVAASILRKQEILKNHRAQLAAKPYETVKNEEAILAAGYENLIPCIPNERYDDTTTRVINALNKRIDIAQLHAIVRTLRRNWYKTEQSTSNSAL